MLAIKMDLWKTKKIVRASDKHCSMNAFDSLNGFGTRETFSDRLRIYTKIYFLIGLFETKLRKVIPVTLRNYSIENGYEMWWECLPLSPKGESSLSTALTKAKKFSKGGSNVQPDEDLPLSFWRYLVRRSTYGNLWIPVLYQAFPNLKQGKGSSSFRELDARFETALITRNRIAHYEMR